MSDEIRCLSSRTVYANRWMTVREDRIERPRSGTGIYGVVEKPDFAVIAAIDDGSIHLVEQYRYPVRGRFWELPQGSWDGADGDAVALAAAELEQETGLVARSIAHVGHLFAAYGYSNQGYDVFLATDLERGEARLDAEEEGLVTRAFRIEELERMIVEGEVRDAATVAAWGLLKLRGAVR